MNIVLFAGCFSSSTAIVEAAVEKMWFKLGQEFAKLGRQVRHIFNRHTSLLSEEKSRGYFTDEFQDYLPSNQCSRRIYWMPFTHGVLFDLAPENRTP